MEPVTRRLTLALIALLAAAPAAQGQYTVREEGEPDPPPRRVIGAPYAFYLPSTGFAAGAAVSTVGYGQPNLGMFLTGYASVNGSYGIYFQGRNLQLSPIDRLFLDMQASSFQFAETDVYIDGNPNFPDERAGSSGSSEDNFVTAEYLDVSANATLRYLLPFGDGKENLVHRYLVKDGMLIAQPSGGTSYNPLDSGRSFVQLIPFLRKQDLDTIDGEGVNDDINTNGLRVGVRWDNTDFTINPSRGNRFEVLFSRDFGVGDSSGTWSSVTGGWQQFIPLGTSSWFQQQVLAMDFWTAHSPTFHYNADGSTTGAPPYYEGATLGGFNRMRGFPGGRFHDRSAISGTAELRLSPVWNPIRDISMLKTLQIEFLQLVTFVEVGNVAPNYVLDDLLSDMKWDAGVGARILARRTLVRVDFAVSDESWQMRALIGQAF